jgi:hypothetical protein
MADFAGFGDPHRVGGTPYITSVALGDIDNDGDLDAAMTGNFVGDFVAYNDGDGNFSGVVPGTWGQYLGTSGHRLQAELADLDNDGDLDVVNEYQRYINQGAYSFTIQDGTGGRGVAVGDLNGDGYADIVVPDKNANTRVYYNDRAGGFYESQILNKGQELNVALGDIDGDGDLDVSVANRVWVNNGSGTLTESGQDLNVAGTSSTWGRTFAYINADAYLDLVVGELQYGCYVLLNDGFGIFTWTGERLSTSFAVATGDFNLDGFTDIVTSNPLDVYLGDGSGLFGDPVQTLPLGNRPGGGLYDVTLGDLNGDGLLDVVSSCGLGAGLDVPTAYMNMGIVPLPGAVLLGMLGIGTAGWCLRRREQLNLSHWRAN